MKKECSKENISFDKMLAKLGLRYYFTPGENFDKKKGHLFNQLYKAWLFGSYMVSLNLLQLHTFLKLFLPLKNLPL